MNQAARTGHAVSPSEKMICVECFRTKGDGDFKLPCQNPRCHFYLCSPSTSIGGIYSTEMVPASFSKEVGHDRKAKICSTSSSNFCPSNQLSTKEQIWKNPSLGPGLMSVPQMAVPKTRSKSTSTISAAGGVVSIPKLLCGYQARVKANMYHPHPRMMSQPECVDPILEREIGGDLVEDAFVKSPLLYDYSERVLDEERYPFAPETDSGISSPFGRQTVITDWMDCPASKTPSVPITSALPTLSSNCASTSTFDMSRLKAEVTKTVNAQVDQSLAVNGRVSPKSPPVNGIAGILGLGELMQCSETYSRKVFVGGLPPEVDEDDIRIFFMRFGAVTVDWPHKSHCRGSIPPKGYAFLLFKTESSIHKLLLSCKPEEDKHFIYMPTSNLTKKKVQVRPWYIADGYHCVDASKPIDPRKAVFVGGVPRPLKASELAEVMTEKYGNVALIVIDSDSELKYPKGAACVVFSSHGSYIAAVSARFMQLNYGALDKKIEIKPYVLDGQMCDECTGVQCNGKPAPFFCGSVMCLQYYCEYCWATVHSMPGRQNHRPLLKDIGDKARFY